jgi:hypothetical protein
MSVTLSDMNEMDFDIFVEKFGNIIEHSALVSAALWTRRPFASIQGVLDEIAGIVQSLPDDGKLHIHCGLFIGSGSITRPFRDPLSGRTRCLARLNFS